MINIKKQEALKIAKALESDKGKRFTYKRGFYRIQVVEPKKKYSIVIEIISAKNLTKNKGSVVTIIAPVGTSQIHFVSDYVVSNELGEVVFFVEEKTKVSAFIINKDAVFNSYIGIEKKFLKSNILNVDTVFLSCIIQLGLVEHKLT